ncbi:MAG: FkbM family methyltransferase [Pseudomonadota bacterium]
MTETPDTFGPYTIVRGQYGRHPVVFAVDHPEDVIQRHHAQGRFYERPELAMIRKAFPANGRFIDIGANVGNHTLFAALVMNAREVVPVEPNARAYNILRANILINAVEDRVDAAWLGFGVGAEAAGGFSLRAPKSNLGAGRMVPEGGNIPVITGDHVVGDAPADFIKIDTEGMEMAVLAGLETTIARDRPAMFIESDDDEREAFLAWLEAHAYVILDTYKRYKVGENFLLVAEEKSKEAARAYHA